MAHGSQGCLVRRESSVASSTAVLSNTDISFIEAGNIIARQAGFADFSTGMRVAIQSSLNTGVWTIKTTDTTHCHLYEAVVAQSSGEAVTLTGHAMQNIGEIVSFNGPALTAAVIDVTTLQSTAKEKLVGVYDAGQVGISVLLSDDATVVLHHALMRDMTARTKRQFDIKFVEETTQKTGAIYFGGYLSGYTISGAVDNALKADITIALTSGVNFIQNAAT